MKKMILNLTFAGIFPFIAQASETNCKVMGTYLDGNNTRNVSYSEVFGSNPKATKEIRCLEHLNRVVGASYKKPSTNNEYKVIAGQMEFNNEGIRMIAVFDGTSFQMKNIYEYVRFVVGVKPKELAKEYSLEFAQVLGKVERIKVRSRYNILSEKWTFSARGRIR